jgi:antitoxin component of RelBE/YafQ-DinJ toxin-antitoxin module
MDFERREPRGIYLTVRIRESERARAEKAAKTAGVTVSELVRAALRNATDEVLAGQP